MHGEDLSLIFFAKWKQIYFFSKSIPPPPLGVRLD
jgi:hypothetical protein